MTLNNRQFGLADDEWFHGSKAHREIEREGLRTDLNEDGTSGPGLYLTRDRSWAKEYGGVYRVQVDLEGANLGYVKTGEDELRMMHDESYDALSQGEDHNLLVLRNKDLIRGWRRE